MDMMAIITWTSWNVDWLCFFRWTLCLISIVILLAIVRSIPPIWRSNQSSCRICSISYSGITHVIGRINLNNMLHHLMYLEISFASILNKLFIAKICWLDNCLVLNCHIYLGKRNSGIILFFMLSKLSSSFRITSLAFKSNPLLKSNVRFISSTHPLLKRKIIAKSSTNEAKTISSAPLPNLKSEQTLFRHPGGKTLVLLQSIFGVVQSLVMLNSAELVITTSSYSYPTRIGVAFLCLSLSGIIFLGLAAFRMKYIKELTILEGHDMFLVKTFSYWTRKTEETIVQRSDIVTSREMQAWEIFKVRGQKLFYMMDKSGTFHNKILLEKLLPPNKLTSAYTDPSYYLHVISSITWDDLVVFHNQRPMSKWWLTLCLVYVLVPITSEWRLEIEMDSLDQLRHLIPIIIRWTTLVYHRTSKANITII